MRESPPGFTAIISAIILTALLLALTFTLSFSGFSSRFNVLGLEYKRISGELAEACVDTAVLRLARDPNYAGGETLDVGAESCAIRPIETAGSQKIIKAQGRYREAYTNLRVAVTITGVEAVPLPPPPPPPPQLCADTLMMLDRTGSMKKPELDDERAAGKSLLTLFSTAVPPPKVAVGRFYGNSAGTLAFAEVQFPIPNGQLTSVYGDDDAGSDSDNDLYHAVESATAVEPGTDPPRGVGKTDISKAINASQAELSSARATSGIAKVLILISDGIANMPAPDTVALEAALDAADAAKLAGTEIYTIHYGEDPPISGHPEPFLGQELLAALASGSEPIPTKFGHGGHGHQPGSLDDKASPAAENADGDHFFISPTSDDLRDLFLFIGQQVCPAVVSSPPPPPPAVKVDAWDELPSL